MVGEASSDVQDLADAVRETAIAGGSAVQQQDMEEDNPDLEAQQNASVPTTMDQKSRITGDENSGVSTTTELSSLSIPKCELPPSAMFEPVENVVAAAVEAQHLHTGGGPPLVDAYRGLMDTLRSKQDLEMMRFILLALRTSGQGRTLTYLTQSATKHAPLIHLVVRLNPFELSTTTTTTDNQDEIKVDYAMADAQLHLLMAIVSANSVFLVPTLNSLWKLLASNKTQQVPVERCACFPCVLVCVLCALNRYISHLRACMHVSILPFILFLL